MTYTMTSDMQDTLNIHDTLDIPGRTIILASGSPRRIEMMHQHGINPVIMPSSAEETLPDGIGMEQSVMFLALKKALWVENKLLGHDFAGTPEDFTYEPQDKNNPLIIAADTIVYKDKIIGKPKDRHDAFEILSLLRGTVHYVATGVSIIEAGKPARRSFADITKVFFKNYTDADINAYIDTAEPYDKAGGYAIQGAWGPYIDHIEGDYNNVVGFPWDHIMRELSKVTSVYPSRFSFK